MGLMELDQDAINMVQKEKQFIGFFSTIYSNYHITIGIFIIVCILVFGLRYLNKTLQFSENKLMINWFGILIIINIILTYVIIIIYRQVNTTLGIPGPPGVQGPIGNKGDDDYCSECNTKIPKFEPKYEGPPFKQPILPDTITVQKQMPRPTPTST